MKKSAPRRSWADCSPGQWFFCAGIPKNEDFPNSAGRPIAVSTIDSSLVAAVTEKDAVTRATLQQVCDFQVNTGFHNL